MTTAGGDASAHNAMVRTQPTAPVDGSEAPVEEVNPEKEIPPHGLE